MILVLDRDPTKCALYHSDEDVVDMCAVYAATLQAAQVELGYNLSPLVAPDEADSKWVAASILHWNWLHDLALVLNEEYKFRFEKSEDHRAFDTLVTTFDAVQDVPGLFPKKDGSSRELFDDSVVQQYRDTYKSKASELKYTKRQPPWWLGPGE